MKPFILLYQLPNEIKIVITAFLFTLSIGFYTGLFFVKKTTNLNPQGIELNYNGNENEEDAEIMKFKKPLKAVITTIHTHVLSMSLIFGIICFIFSLTDYKSKWKSFLLIEPFISIILTFGGIYFVWKGIYWFNYIVMFSGILMTLSYTFILILTLLNLFKKS